MILRKDKIRADPNTQSDLFLKLLETHTNTKWVKEFKFHPKRRWRFDYACEEHRIAVEIEGGVWIRGRHITPIGFLRDMEKYNTATQLGWKVLRFTVEDKNKAETFNIISNTISTSLMGM